MGDCEAVTVVLSGRCPVVRGGPAEALRRTVQLTATSWQERTLGNPAVERTAGTILAQRGACEPACKGRRETAV